MAARSVLKWVSACAALFLGGFGCGGIQSGDHGGRAPMAIAALAFPGNGTLIVASRERTVVLDSHLNEITRIAPPYPFDPNVAAPGLMYFSFSRDGSIGALAWQQDNISKVPTVDAGVLFYRIPSGERVWSSFMTMTKFGLQGSQISPDGTAWVSLFDDVVQVTGVSDGGMRWSVPDKLLPDVQFTGDGSSVVTVAQTQIRILSASDGAERETFALPDRTSWATVAVSGDGSTLAVFVDQVASPERLAVGRLSDGAPLTEISLPAGVGGVPHVLALSASGDRLAGAFANYGRETLVVWQGQRLLYRFDRPGNGPVTFSPDGAVLATANGSDGVVLRDAATGTVLAQRWIPAAP